MKPAITESVALSVTETEVKGKVEKRSGKRVGYNYIIVKSYKESQKNDVVKCLFIKSLTNFGFCVIKEGSYGDTKDKNDRDIIDRLKWQKQLHHELQDKLPIPRLLDHFEERGNYYLVIEHIGGKALQKLCSEQRKLLRQAIIKGDKLGLQFLDYLIQITNILTILHDLQLVHRDATPNNYMITHNGKVALIDMELCYSVQQQFPSPAFQLGTSGYMSPQQEASNVPTTAEDIFALGAIILQVWSGVSPSKFMGESTDTLQEKVKFFIPDQQIAEIVLHCLHPEDIKRPRAKQINQLLQGYISDLKTKTTREVNQQRPYSRKEILAKVQEGINTLSTPLLVDDEKGWFADDMKPLTNEEKHKLRKQWYASYNRGVSGVIYLLTQAKRIGLDITASQPFIEKGITLIKEKYIKRIDRASSGLHFGSDGIAAVLASAIQNEMIEPTSEYLDWIDQLLEKPGSALDIKNGVAGQGMVNLICKRFINGVKMQERLRQYAELLISKQQKDGCWVNGYYRQKYTKRKKRKVIFGFAEGMAGIIYFLLEYGHQYKHEQSINSAQLGLKWLMKQARHKKDTLQWPAFRKKELSYDWADGTAGIALTFIKGFELTGSAIYKQYAIKTLQSIPAFITDSNLGQRNGLSGLGEVYLEAYYIFKDNVWLQRADWLAQVVVHLSKQNTKHGTYWLVENERQPVANFMIGNCGVLHFLLRYCYPDSIKYPLLNNDKS